MSSEAQTSPSPVLQRWKMSDAGIVGLVFIVALGIGIWLAPNARTTLPSVHATYYQRSQVSLLVAIFAQLVAVTFTVIAIGRVRGIGNLLSSIGWNPNRYIGSCALVGLGLAAVITIALTLTFGGVSKFRDGFAPLSILLYVLTTVLVQPFMEEYYFCGVLFIAVSERFGQFGTVALTSLLFGLYHVGGYRIILVFLTVGVVLAIARIKTRSVAACFALHAAYNVGILVYGFLLGR